MTEKTTAPPVLYVPVRRNAEDRVEVCRMPMGGGKQALLAYTALDRVAKGCGEGQEWVMIFTSTLSTVKEEASFDGDQLEHLLSDLQPYVDDLYGSLRDTPSIDGGAASNMIALITSAGAEVSQTVANSYLALMALAREVVKDFAANDEAAVQEFQSYEAQIDQWLADNMAPLIGRVGEMSEVAAIYGALRDGSELVVDGALEAADARVVVRLADWRAGQDALSDLATSARDASRSGNPARRAAFEALDFKGNAARIGDLEVKIGRVAHYSKIIPIAGTVIDLSLAGYDIAHGESESSVLAGLGGGVVGGAGGGALAVALGIPGVGEAVAVVAGAVLVDKGARWLWEANVPLDVRESVDYWLEENVFWDPTTGTLATS